MEPKVSIVIPTYNRCDVICKAIDSVINQTYDNWELLIVDDRSNDRTEEVLEEKYLENNKIYFFSRPSSRPKGANACRNIGIEKSNGEYVAFLDSDDEWYADKIQKKVHHIQSNNLFDTKVILYNQSKIKLKNKDITIPDRGIGESEKISDYLMLNDGFIQTSSFFIPRSQLNGLRFNEDLPRHQDLEFVLKAESNGFSFEFIKEPLVKIHWEENANLKKKGWSPEFSKKFAQNNRKLFTNKSYHNFLFSKVILNTLKYGDKKEAFKNIQNIDLTYVTLRNYLRFFKHLFFS